MKHALVLLTVGLLLVLVQAMPWHFLFPGGGTLNVSFAIVIIAGIYDTSLNSWFLAFILGYILESLSGSPQGLVSLVNLLALLIMRILDRFILFESFFTQILLVFVLCSAADITILAATRAITYSSLNTMLAVVALRSAITVILSIPLLHFWHKIAPVPER